MNKVAFLMGATNCGKTTAINDLSKMIDTFYPVVVGKVLRSMFPPDYFDGQAAPAKTDKLAFKIMCDGINEAHAKGKIPLIDGQPRNQVQLSWCCESYIDNDKYDCRLLHLWAPRDIRVERAKRRDNDPAKLKLSMDRMDGDVLVLYDLWLQLQTRADKMLVVDTSRSEYYKDMISFIED